MARRPPVVGEFRLRHRRIAAASDRYAGPVWVAELPPHGELWGVAVRGEGMESEGNGRRASRSGDGAESRYGLPRSQRAPILGHGRVGIGGMRMIRGRVSSRLVGSLLPLLPLAALTSACVVNEPEAPTRGVVVTGPPPAPMHEERPAPPNAQASWVAGYWHWTGMQYAWIPGHWEAPPPAAVWAAPKVTTMPDGRYVYESGGWRKLPESQPTQQRALR